MPSCDLCSSKSPARCIDLSVSGSEWVYVCPECMMKLADCACAIQLAHQTHRVIETKVRKGLGLTERAKRNSESDLCEE